MPLAVQPITPAVAAIAAELGVALQPGTVVSAQVLKVLDANLVRIAIGSLTLDAATINPLQQGQTLQLAVGRTATALTLTPLSDDAASAARLPAVAGGDVPLAPDEGLSARPALTPQETRVVATAAQNAVTRQAGLSQLFANLSTALEAGATPQPVAEAATQLLALRQSAAGVDGDRIKAALNASGLMLEATMAQSSSGAAPDLKSALLVLRQALSSWLVDVDSTAGRTPTATASASDAANTKAPLPLATRAAAGDALSAAVQAIVTQGHPAANAAASKNLLAMQLIASASRAPSDAPAEQEARNALPPPFRGGLPSAQAVAAPLLAPDDTPAEIARQLLNDTDGALARQTLLQVASLPDRIDQQTLRSDPAQPRWNFEIPFVTPQGTAMAQFEIARDGGGQEAEAAQRLWHARFSLSLEPAGPVHALITFGGEATHVKMWAERPATAQQLRANVGELNTSFTRVDLTAGDIVVVDGAPAQARPPSAGHFLNRAT